MADMTNEGVSSYSPIASPGGVASGRYGALRSLRDPFLQRARDMAALTLPYLFRQEGDNGSTQTEVPWDSLGAYCVTNLAGKITFSFFPPDVPPMQLSPSAQTRKELDAVEDEDQRADMEEAINKGLSKVEAEFVEAFEEDNDRAILHVGVLKELVGGNHGFQLYDDGQLRGISLDRYVVKRDPAGNLIEFVVEDPLDWTTLPPNIQAQIHAQGFNPPPVGATATICVYTHGYLKVQPPYTGKMWTVYQEVWNFEVEGSRRTLNPDALPYFFVPWLLLDGEDYGRSYVEYYEGDFQTAEGNTQTVTEGSAAAARSVTLVHPGGLTSRKAYAEAPNGAVLSGRAEDVTVPEVSKSSDFQTAMAVIDKAEQRLSRAFLLASSIQRQGERVTATEIRTVAAELENALGGIYSQQVVSLQKPYVTAKLRLLQKAGRVTALPKGTTKVTITAGLAALGRNAEMDALNSWAQFMASMLGPTWTQALGPKAIVRIGQRGADALHLDLSGVLPSDQELQQQQQAQLAQSMAQALGPEAIKQLGNNLTSNQVASTNADAKLQAEGMKQLPAPQAAQTDQQ